MAGRLVSLIPYLYCIIGELKGGSLDNGGSTILKENIFSTLAKYNSAVDENYLTESFVFVINTLLKQEPQIGLKILNNLCFNDNEFCFNANESVSVSTQEVTEEGTPDIKVSSLDKLIYIEVKHDSPLGYKQLSRYKKALEASTANIKHIVLLTRFAVDIEDEVEKPYKHIRWFQVYNWLSEIGKESKKPVNKYLIESFNSFLEVKQMSLQKVGWEYINGVPALNNLLSMLEVGLQGASLTIYGKSSGWDFKGFWLEKKEYIAGIHFNSHLIITFEITEKGKYNRSLLEHPSYELREGKERLWFHLPLEKCHFFSLDKDEQLELLTKFIKTAYAEAQQMKVK